MLKPLIVIPLYNHAKTLGKVFSGVKEYYKDILIVNDASTDNAEQIIKELGAISIKHSHNMGKGQAILTAAAYAKENNFSHILTIDADDQHCPKDLPKLIDKAKEFPYSIIIGKRDFNTENVPGSSKFGRAFSGFWARVQTGKKIVDMQSGLRVYPVQLFDYIKPNSTHFDFEVEIIIKAIWAGFGVEEVDVSVKYPKREERVSHFKLFKDNLRISILNTKLTIRALLPVPYQQYAKSEDGKLAPVNPFKVVKEQLKAKESPKRLGISAAWSVFWGSLALPGVRTMCLLTGIGYFNLNRPVSLTMDKLAMPPFIPALCIMVGYYMRHGYWLTEFNLTTLGYQAGQRIWEWVLGSLVVAPLFALIIGIIVFLVGKLIRKGIIFSGR
ncbi:MAG: glycosyltransferase family 2 protein [Elusimicrobiota bacterium]|jgi:glycosyltransferase involved in cell wall biosynthesis|nr:glycosyltransferase family 2 protein [Elusimicrobiota bacterium]